VEVNNAELFDIELFTCLDLTELCSLTESTDVSMKYRQFYLKLRTIYSGIIRYKRKSSECICSRKR